MKVTNNFILNIKKKGIFHKYPLDKEKIRDNNKLDNRSYHKVTMKV